MTASAPGAAGDKASLRGHAKAQRAAAAAANPDAGARLADHVVAWLKAHTARTVAAYWPLGDEIDPRPALHRLYQGGWAVGLPVMQGTDAPLVFRAWHPDAVLVPGGFGTQVPEPECPEVVPDVLLVPMLAYDRAGYRLGYGGGFYDRTLEKLRAERPGTAAVGVAYSGQEVAELPRDATDQPLDALLTEAGPVTLTGGG